MMHQRLAFIDTLRGIAVLSVVIQHALEVIVREHPTGGYHAIFHDAIGYYMNFGRFGVVLFFFVSGFVIPFSFPASASPVNDFSVSRFFRLYPAYWASIALGLVTMQLVESKTYALTQIAVNLTMLQEIMAADGVVVEPGDILLLHTGFATRILEWNREPDPVEVHATCSYLDARDESLLEWIADSQISALVADNYAVEGLLGKDRHPERHSFLPIHHLCLFKLGVPLGELWYLHELAAWLRANDRSRFLLTAPPLRLPGIVGSPVTPIATV